MIVSILIHNLNRASALRRCLESVLCQTYRPIEAVVLDAGSIDDSWAVIQQSMEQLRNRGIEARAEQCCVMGVATSRNLAARVARGSLLIFLDNDAVFESSDSVARAVARFERDTRLALVSFRVLRADTEEIDHSAWVFRRPANVWAARPFGTFTFTGGAFCVRAGAFQQAGGFWDHLAYSREEEDLAMELIKRDWKIVYEPSVVVRHYADARGRSSLAHRRYTELKNGILVLWRRLPVPIALLAISGRIGTMCVKSITTGEQSISQLLPAVAHAFQDWRQHHLKRVPIGIRSTLKYARLHFAR